jgi:PKD repeat protein
LSVFFKINHIKKMKKISTIIAACAAALISFTASAAPVPLHCDTLTNLTSRDTLGVLYFNGSLLAGNNTYGDMEKAEHFRGPQGSVLTGAFIGFGYVSILPSDTSSPVTINAYSDSLGAPGATIATATVTLGQIAAAINSGTEVYVTFTSPPALTSQSFYVSVVLPTTTGDTIAVLTNQMFSLDGQGWEKWSDSTWHSYVQAYGTSPNFFGNDIQAVTCGGAPLAAFQSSLLVNFCALSQTIYFYNTSSNGVDSIRWSFPGGTPATSTVANPVVTYAPGAYNVLLVAYGSGANDTSATAVFLAPAVTGSTTFTPASGPTDTNGTATVTVLTGTPPFIYSWSDSAQDTSAHVTRLAPGTYTVSIMDSNYCSVVDTVVVGYTTGICCIVSDRAIQVFPSPATDVLNIVWDAATTADLSITDISGKVLGRYSVANTFSHALDIRGLAPGTYILSIRDTSGHAAQSVRFSKL